MATRYSIVARPTNGVSVADKLQAPDGTVATSTVVGNVCAIPTGNIAAVLQSLVNNVVQPSAAQLVGLRGYLAAIEAGTATTAVETAIAAL